MTDRETPRRSLGQRLRELLVEFQARRAGRQAMPLHHDLSIAARGVLGVTGSGTSSAWDRLAESGTAYSRSLEPDRIPQRTVHRGLWQIGCLGLDPRLGPGRAFPRRFSL